MFGLEKVLEAVLAEIEQGHVIAQLFPSRLREQHLSTMSGSHYARCSVHIKADVCAID
jgi:hypothetical protein